MMLNRWLLNALCALPVAAGIEQVYKTPAEPLAFAGCSLIAIGTVFIVGNEAHGILSHIERLAGYSILDKNLDAQEITIRNRVQPAPGRHIPNLNTLNQVVNIPKIDLEREMARTLNNMRLGGFKMDISETYWIREKHWNGEPSEFKGTRAKWEHYNIVRKKGSASNSQYVVMNERAVELIANGSIKLPTPPS